MRNLTDEETEIYNNWIEVEAVDVKPVIYCKSCKYARKQNDDKIYCTYFGCGALAQDDFCSYAIQK